MANAIWKYEFEVEDGIQGKEMPHGTNLLYVDVQAGLITLWARVDAGKKNETRLFRVVGTGHRLNPSDHYVGTVQMPPLVWHLMEVRE